MAVLRVDGGNGTTQNPRNLNASTARTTGQNPSGDWWNKYMSSYNRPTTVMSADYYARQAAAKRNAELIAEAQQRAEEARKAQEALLRQREEEARKRSQQAAAAREAGQAQAQANEPVSIVGDLPAGPIGQFLSNPLGNLSNWLTSEAPNPFPTPLGPDGKPLPSAAQQAQTKAGMEGVSSTRGPDKPGYIQQPVLGGNGETVGYEYVKLVSPKPVTADEATAAVQNVDTSTPAGIARASGQQAPGPAPTTIYDEVASLEQSYAKRRYDAAVRAWGEPTKEKNPDGSERLVWGTNGMEFLGMAPGEIASPTLQAPAEDAPYKDWVKYRDRLKSQQSIMDKKMYTESSVKEAYYGMGTKGVKDMQRAFLAAGLYDSNDIVALGNVGEKELSFMRDLMTMANINGTTWEEQFSIFQSAAAEQKARGYGGGGGGGGGGGTSVYTQIQYTQTSMAQGRALLISVLKGALGRYPTDDEISRFIDMLNKAESKSPTKTVTRTTTAGKSTRAVSRTTPSAVDAQAMAEEFAQGIGGGKPYKANARDRYLGALLDSMGGTSV